MGDFEKEVLLESVEDFMGSEKAQAAIVPLSSDGMYVAIGSLKDIISLAEREMEVKRTRELNRKLRGLI